MADRCAIIPGIDPEVTVHGELPPCAEASPVTRISAIDLREDREKFGEIGNPIIDSFPSKISAPWWCFNSIGCTIPDAIVHNRLIFHKNLPVVGIGNLRWEVKAAEVAQRGELKIAEPVEHFKGRTGLLAGRSAFNYYHFMADVLIFMEDLLRLVDELNLDRIVINPCRADDDGFQRKLIQRIYPDIANKVIFTDQAFSAEELTFVCVWPNMFSHGTDEEAVGRHGPRGVARRAYRACAKPFFERAEQAIGSRDFDDRKDVIIVSRREAIRRKVINEDELCEALAPFDVKPIIMEKLTVPEQMDLMAGARVVIGPHGAGMINTGFCQAGAHCIELTGRHYLQRGPMFATVGIVRQAKYEFLVGDEHGEIEHMKGNEGNDVHLGPRAIQHIVERVDVATSARTPDDVTTG